MAAAWIDADRVAIDRALRLLDAAQRGSTAAATELRHLEDRFGLSPAARRRLEWEIERASSSPAPVVALDEPRPDPRAS